MKLRALAKDAIENRVDMFGVITKVELIAEKEGGGQSLPDVDVSEATLQVGR